jgi:hypothetical protein
MNWPRTIEMNRTARQQSKPSLMACEVFALATTIVVVRRPVEKFFRFLMAPAARRHSVDAEMPSFTIA